MPKNIFDPGEIPKGIDSTLAFPSSGLKKGKGKKKGISAKKTTSGIEFNIEGKGKGFSNIYGGL